MATVLVALPYKAFDLDRYFLPKEVVLTLSAGIIAVVVLAAGRIRQLALSRVDLFLVGYAGLSAISSLFAPNGWLAMRAMGVTLSGLALFWSARYLARFGLARRLVRGIAIAAVAVAVTSLLQAYGLRTDFFSLNRAPGGTLGNRNFIAHAVAIGSPAIVLSLLWAKGRRTIVGWSISIAVVAAALALSRSRAAWLAMSLGLLAGFLAALHMRQGNGKKSSAPTGSWRRHPHALRTGSALLAAVVGVVAAIALPNTLNWRSRSPYLDSVVGVVDYREGSGHGRVVQYLHTLHMAVEHPLLGVGPGNWPVVYPHLVAANDPSISREDGMTENPWPSSDWAAVLAERGLIASACLLLALFGLVVEATRVFAKSSAFAREAALALVVTVVILAVVAAFDAVLLLPAPTALAWGILGTLDGMLDPAPTVRATHSIPKAGLVAAIVALVLATEVAVARGMARVHAMALVSRDDGTRTLLRAAALDPSSYRLQIKAAEVEARRPNCAGVKAHAERAHKLFPYAPAPRRLLADCEAAPTGATRP